MLQGITCLTLHISLQSDHWAWSLLSVILRIMGRAYWHQGLFMSCLPTLSSFLRLTNDRPETSLRCNEALFTGPQLLLSLRSGCNNASVTQSVMTHLYHCQCHYNITVLPFTCPLMCTPWLNKNVFWSSIFFKPSKESFPEVLGVLWLLQLQNESADCSMKRIFLFISWCREWGLTSEFLLNFGPISGSDLHSPHKIETWRERRERVSVLHNDNLENIFISSFSFAHNHQKCQHSLDSDDAWAS